MYASASMQHGHYSSVFTLLALFDVFWCKLSLLISSPQVVLSIGWLVAVNVVTS
jgi:hypothetical protein